jgi:hypothetical protein
MSFLLLLLLFPLSLSANPARKVVVHKDEVITVRTAVGIASIIQVPDQPTSIVLGDSSAFKVEYLNEAVTIKPLHGHATSNLYIHTDFARYSVKLVAGAQGSADYVVYLTPFEAPKPKNETLDKNLHWKSVGISRKSSFGRAMLVRLAKTQTSILIEFAITPNRDTKIDPGSFWLLQKKVSRPIQDLLLSALDLKKGQSATATLVIKKSDLKFGEPAEVAIRLKESFSFHISRELLWKN